MLKNLVGKNAALVLLSAACLLGCASLKEAGKCFLGVSTKVLEDNLCSAIAKSFNLGYQDSFLKSVAALGKIGSYIYRKDVKGQMIALCVSAEDTTAVGVFFKSVDSANTEVAISSPSSYAKELIAKRLFARLAGLPDPLEPKEGAKPAEKLF